MAEDGYRALDLIKDTSISYLVQLGLDKLFSCLKNGVGSLLGDEGDELEKIKSSLNNIHSVIGSAEERPLKDQALIDWLEKLKDVAYDADDVLDEYATEDLRRKVEAQNSNSVRDPVTNKLRKIASSISIYPVLNRTKMTSKLKEIRERLESIEEERHKFQLSERVKNWEYEFKEHRQTHSFVYESELYGRDEDKEKIVNMLLLPVAGHEDENVSVIPIVGMGGLGKTTLAQLVFNDDRVQKQNHFELKMWVCVSDDFNVRRLMGKIIGRVTPSDSNVSDLDLDELQRRLQKALFGRRLLLVLDDVWNEELEKWNRLRVLLMCGGKGSRIVVTTRNPMIASIMSKIEPHHLEGLSEGDCWKMFASRTFPDDREGDHPKLVEIGKSIVSKCRGVPLAVITLGSLLSFKREESQWVFVRDSELWKLAAEDVRGILPALRLSYYHLNPQLRQCFAFCAIFPKDYNMGKELLMQLWMAHGCVPSIRGMELEDIGIEILNELLMRSLFQEVKDEKDGSLKIKVHDLVHDLAQSVMGNDCCIIEPGKSVNVYKRVRHLSFCQINSPGDFFYEGQSLRTFIMLDSHFVIPRDIAISKFLRVLDLRCFQQPPLLTSLGELMHLRYFCLVHASFETLPDSISSLQNLQTLKLFCCFLLRELPESTKNLINLRCLDIDRCVSLSHMPAKIGMLSCLRKLPLFVVGDSASDCSGIEELQCLNQLKGNLKIEHLERLAIPSNAQRANLIGKPNLDSLHLSWHKPNDDENTLKIEAEEEVLRGLQPHTNLKELEISGYGGIHFTSWMISFWLPSIVKITLKYCRRCELLPPLGQLPLLKFLHIEGMDRVENIASEFYFYGNDMSEVFPSLETLEIEGMSSLKVWSGLDGERVFPRLVKLEIMYCPMLTTIPCFPYLKNLKLGSTHPLLLRSVTNCTSLSSFEMEYYDDLTSLPQGMLQSLTSLKSLKIEECENLSSLQMRLQNPTSLEYMKLWSCGLLSFPDEVEIQGLSSLLELTIYNCKEMISLSTGVQYLSALQTLSIKQCDKLANLPDELQYLTSLQILKISHCTNLKSLPEGIGNLSSLKELSLKDVGLTSLPESMQELSTLRKLRILSCPQLPCLPEWVENLTALQFLTIHYCPQMVSLPVGLQRLTRLQKLLIMGCPEMQRRCVETGQDLHKIQHIPEVKFG